MTGLSWLDLLRILLAAAGLLLAVLSFRLARWVACAQHSEHVPRTPTCWAVSYALFAAYTAGDVLSRLGANHFTWRVPGYAAAVLVGWYACWHFRRLCRANPCCEGSRRR